MVSKKRTSAVILSFLLFCFIGCVSFSGVSSPLIGNANTAGISKEYTEIQSIFETESIYLKDSSRKGEFTVCLRAYISPGNKAEVTGIDWNKAIHQCLPEDKYSHYSTPAEYAMSLGRMSNQSGAVGIIISTHIDVLGKGPLGAVVESLQEGGPAERSGVIQIGDIITRVGDSKETIRSVAGFSDSSVASLLRGEPGTEVFFEIWRNGRVLGIFSLVRQESDDIYIDWRLYEDGAIGYIRFRLFNDAISYKKIAPAMKRLQQLGVRKIIFDLRGNFGGSVREAKRIMQLFASSQNELLYSLHLQDRSYSYYSTREVLKSGDIVEWGLFPDWKVAILVDKDTASAAEMFAGALQLKGAFLIGERTYGKGTAHYTHLLRSGGAVTFTFATYHFANGVTPDKAGLIPDRKVSGSLIGASVDTALAEALRYLRNLKHNE